MNRNSRIGQFIPCNPSGGETYHAYVPKPLPPMPALDMRRLYPLLDQAAAALGRLDGISMVLPDPSLFIYMYVRKEAVFSSQIEGTQSSLSDLLLFETEAAPGVPVDDVTEVSCYVAAMNHGLESLARLPLSLRLLREIHEKLMSSGRGSHKQPGQFRTSQNWIGGSRPGNAQFVPPPPEHMTAALHDFEKFLHDRSVNLPVLVRAAMAHVQFETIHPFLDGNGRLGRLLITFILCAEGMLIQPMLYLSLYFKQNRQAYYDHLQAVRQRGTWEDWVEFFLTGVIDTAKQATDMAQAVVKLFRHHRYTLDNSDKVTNGALQLYTYMQRHPVANTAKIRAFTKLSLPTVLRAAAVLQELGIIREITGKERHKIYAYDAYLELLGADAVAPMALAADSAPAARM
jgi:Fic family protein